MDIKDLLRSLPPPDPHGPDRVWQRARQTEERERRQWWVFPIGLLVAAAGLAIVLQPPQPERALELESPQGRQAVAWSEDVQFDFEGTGSVEGTPDDIVIEWQDGTLHAEVVPNRGTGLEIRTSEATVTVVGTVFEVHRDALGTTTQVMRGKVDVACADGWSGLVTDATGPHTCLPVRPAMLLGRATLLHKRGHDVEQVMDALNRGLRLSDETSAVRGELLAFRMEVLGDAGRYADAIADADAYLALDGPRSVEVRRFAGWLALSDQGCEQALPYLEGLGAHATDEDRILIAECWVARDRDRARRWMEQVDRSALDASWSDRASIVMGRINGGTQ